MWKPRDGSCAAVPRRHADTEATGCRVGELEAARIGDLDLERRTWLVRAVVSKTRRARWVQLPADLFEALSARLPPPEDRDPGSPLFPGVTSDRLRMAIRRACRDAGIPIFGPHSLRHRYISLAHKRSGLVEVPPKSGAFVFQAGTSLKGVFVKCSRQLPCPNNYRSSPLAPGQTTTVSAAESGGSACS
jgi:integrase